MNRLYTSIVLGVTTACWSGAVIRPPENLNTNLLGNLHLRSPFAFEPNVGQAGPGAKFVARAPDYMLTLSGGEIALTYFEGFGDVDEWFRDEVLTLKLVGVKVSAEARGLDQQPARCASCLFRLIHRRGWDAAGSRPARPALPTFRTPIGPSIGASDTCSGSR